jgi:hypothetical protein
MAHNDELSSDQLQAILAGMGKPCTELEQFVGHKLTIEEELALRTQLLYLVERMEKFQQRRKS